MGSYTQSIREILQANKTSEQKLTNVTDVHDIAMNVLFDEAPINVISSEYRNTFVTGFVLHFFNDELGLETLPLWKIALNEKLINNAEFINLIYSNLDKQVFADYHMTQTQSSGNTRDDRTGSSSGTNNKTDSSVTHVDDDNTHSSTDVIDNTKKTTREGSDEVAHTGTNTTSGENSQTVEGSDNRSTDTNGISIVSDTPMGSLQNLRTPGGDAKGTGVTYANYQTYNYMSGATEQDQSVVDIDTTSQSTEGTDSTSATYNEKNTTSYDSIDTVKEDGTNKGSSSDTRDIDTTVTNTASETSTGTTSDISVGEHSDNSTTTDYSMNYEMIMKAMPYLNRVWDIFNDIFMILL